MVELLSPAGSLEKLKIALLYGADAVYIGGQNYSLRANAKNFSIPEIKEACDFAHARNKKVYVTVNIAFHNEDLDGIVEYLKELEKCHVDAIIVSDPCIIDIEKENNIKIPIHISTQSSTLNIEAAKFYKDLGVTRIVLAREANKQDIKDIIDKTGLEVEIFIHGAMCSSISGRCVLSNYFTNRDANRGGCAQICRWEFSLIKDGNIINNPTKFTMSSKDLCMLEEINNIIDIGVTSLKIEGRMRSVYYIATVVNMYRRMIDDVINNRVTKEKTTYYQKILNRVANRSSCVQFFNKMPSTEEQYYLGREEISNQDYLGLVEKYQDGYAYIRVKNYFKLQDEVEFIRPSGDNYHFTITEIKNEDGELIDVCNHPEELILIKFPKEVQENDILRVLIK